MTSSSLGFAGFLVVSAGLHLGVLAWGQEAGGATSAGDGGEALVSIAAADGDLVELVALWETPPDTSATKAPELFLPESSGPDLAAPDEAPALADPETVVPPDPAPDQPLVASQPVPDLVPVATPVPDALPGIAPPPPPPKPAPPARKIPPAPKKPPKPAGPEARNGQRAAGAGGAGARGDRGEAGAATARQGQARQARAEWGAAIRARIETARRAPAGTGAGRVRIVLDVARTGALLSSRVAGSSGTPDLDRAALDAVRRARLPPAPPALPDASLRFNITLEFGY